MRALSRRRTDVADAIRIRIRAGEWEPGDLVPSTAAFAKEYGIGTTTASEALGILVREGTLEAENGKGRRVPFESGSDD